MVNFEDVRMKLREAWRYANMAAESLQTAKESEVNREEMIELAEEQLKHAMAAIAYLSEMTTETAESSQ